MYGGHSRRGVAVGFLAHTFSLSVSRAEVASSSNRILRWPYMLMSIKMLATILKAKIL